MSTSSSFINQQNLGGSGNSKIPDGLAYENQGFQGSTGTRQPKNSEYPGGGGGEEGFGSL